MARRLLAIAAVLICAAVLVSVERAPERPLPTQPSPDAQEYASAATSLAHGKGFYTYVHNNTREPPRYPPGYPMALAPFAAVGSFPRNVQRGAKFWALVYVLVAVAAAWVLAGPEAGAIAAILIGLSPFARESAGLVLSDAFTAVMAVAALPVLFLPTRSGARLAGAAGGFAAVARVTGAVNVIAVLVATPRSAWKSVLVFALPFLIGLALLQWGMFGSPLETGYDYWKANDHHFSLSFITSAATLREGPFVFAGHPTGLLDWVCPCRVGGPPASLPNLTFYPLVLGGMIWLFAPPFVPLLGLAYALVHRREPFARYTLVVTLLTLLVFEVYKFQAARFMAAPATLLTVLASVCAARLLQRLFAHTRVTRPGTARGRTS